MNVKELHSEQVYLLKTEMFYGTDYNAPLFDEYDIPEDIPDNLVFERYAGIDFVDEDFGIFFEEED